jgi:2-polyprenyl-6-methoxyphenol hydroxylase-like FAD-dependent oxidoreductase
MQQQSVQRVLIAGGGIGGLVAAIALQREGIAVSVFERVKKLEEVGAGLTLWANALRAFHQIGLTDMLRSVGRPVTRSCILSWQGEILAEMPVEALTKHFGIPMVAVHRADLQAALLTALGEGIVQMGTTCTGFQQEDMEVQAYLADGLEVTGDLLLGADGLHSTIRAQLFGATPPGYAGYTAWRGVAPIMPRQWGEQMTTETWGNGRRFGLVPLSQGRMYWFATLNTPEGMGDREGGRKQELLELFHTCHDPVPDVIEATDEASILHNDIYDRPSLPHWSQERVALLGDAAHPMTPNLGQGACQAIEDAVTLARCLTTQHTLASALQAYEKQRLKRANAVVQQSARIGQVAQWEGSLAATMRNTAIKMLPTPLLFKQLERVLKAP